MKNTPSHANANNNDNAFKALTDVTEKLCQGRGDNVAIIGIIGLVSAFMTAICITGFVLIDKNHPRNDLPQSPSTPTIQNQQNLTN